MRVPLVVAVVVVVVVVVAVVVVHTAFFIAWPKAR
jgi:hypothetical protein